MNASGQAVRARVDVRYGTGTAAASLPAGCPLPGVRDVPRLPEPEGARMTTHLAECTRHGCVFAVGLVAVALLATACSHSSSGPGVAHVGSAANASGSPSSSASASGVGFSQCMRSHGVPNFPDPNADGRPLQVDAQQLGVSDSLYLAAERACQHLLPTTGSLAQLTHQCLLFGDCPSTLVRQLLTVERRYAQCLRAHGLPNWPDPSISPKGVVPFSISPALGSTRSSRIPRSSGPRISNVGA
jgi:hypothetical protein